MIRLSLVFLAACTSFIDGKAAETTLKILDKAQLIAQREGDIELARAAVPGGIFQLEAFALAYPDQPRFRELHTESLCQYTVAFVFDDWEDAALAGRDASPIAERLTGLLDRCAAANRARLPAGWTVETTTRAQVPAVLWLATTGAVRLAIAPLLHVAELPAIEAELRRCAALAPGFHAASAETLLATVVAGRAQLFGGPDGTAEFTAARALAPGALLVEVMFARTRKDRALFEATLAKVLAADVAPWPDLRLANELARRKARRYLAAEATLLPE